MNCEFCHKVLASEKILKRHQATTAKCLEIQKLAKLPTPIVKCKFCDINVSKSHISRHLKSCEKKIEYDADLKYKTMYEKENEKLKEEIERLKEDAKESKAYFERVIFKVSTQQLNTSQSTADDIIEESNKHFKKLKQTRKSIPKAIRMKIWDNNFGDTLVGSCYTCDREIRIDNFEAGHIIADSCGGEMHVDNFKPVCKPCNSSMGTLNLEQFNQLLKSVGTKNFLEMEVKESYTNDINYINDDEEIDLT